MFRESVEFRRPYVLEEDPGYRAYVKQKTREKRERQKGLSEFNLVDSMNDAAVAHLYRVAIGGGHTEVFIPKTKATTRLVTIFTFLKPSKKHCMRMAFAYGNDDVLVACSVRLQDGEEELPIEGVVYNANSFEFEQTQSATQTALAVVSVQKLHRCPYGNDDGATKTWCVKLVARNHQLLCDTTEPGTFAYAENRRAVDNISLMEQFCRDNHLYIDGAPVTVKTSYNDIVAQHGIEYALNELNAIFKRRACTCRTLVSVIAKAVCNAEREGVDCLKWRKVLMEHVTTLSQLCDGVFPRLERPEPTQLVLLNTREAEVIYHALRVDPHYSLIWHHASIVDPIDGSVFTWPPTIGVKRTILNNVADLRRVCVVLSMVEAACALESIKIGMHVGVQHHAESINLLEACAVAQPQNDVNDYLNAAFFGRELLLTASCCTTILPMCHYPKGDDSAAYDEDLLVQLLTLTQLYQTPEAGDRYIFASQSWNVSRCEVVQTSKAGYEASHTLEDNYEVLLAQFSDDSPFRYFYLVSDADKIDTIAALPLWVSKRYAYCVVPSGLSVAYLARRWSSLHNAQSSTAKQLYCQISHHANPNVGCTHLQSLNGVVTILYGHDNAVESYLTTKDNIDKLPTDGVIVLACCRLPQELIRRLLRKCCTIVAAGGKPINSDCKRLVNAFCASFASGQSAASALRYAKCDAAAFNDGIVDDDSYAFYVYGYNAQAKVALCETRSPSTHEHIGLRIKQTVIDSSNRLKFEFPASRLLGVCRKILDMLHWQRSSDENGCAWTITSEAEKSLPGRVKKPAHEKRFEKGKAFSNEKTVERTGLGAGVVAKKDVNGVGVISVRIKSREFYWESSHGGTHFSPGFGKIIPRSGGDKTVFDTEDGSLTGGVPEIFFFVCCQVAMAMDACPSFKRSMLDVDVWGFPIRVQLPKDLHGVPMLLNIFPNESGTVKKFDALDKATRFIEGEFSALTELLLQ